MVVRTRKGKSSRAPSRQALLFIVFFLIIIAAGYGYSKISERNTSRQSGSAVQGSANVNVTVVQEEPMTLYRNETHGFTLSHPQSWQVSSGSAGAGENKIIVLNFYSTTEIVALSIMDPSFEETIRNSLSLQGESQREMAGLPVREISGTSFKDGSPETLLLIEHGNLLYVFRGFGENLNRIAKTIQFTQ